MPQWWNWQTPGTCPSSSLAERSDFKHLVAGSIPVLGTKNPLGDKPVPVRVRSAAPSIFIVADVNIGEVANNDGNSYLRIR